MPFSISQLTGQDDHHLVKNLDHHVQLTERTSFHLNKMILRGKEDGLDIKVVSSFRSFNRQLTIWNEKYCGKRAVYSEKGIPIKVDHLSPKERIKAILIWTALPGTSRHHWGTDLDIIDQSTMPEGYKIQLTPDEFLNEGVFHRLNGWLDKHATQYSFFRPYKGVKSGYQAEPWHISFIEEAEDFLLRLTLEELAPLLQRANIYGKSEIIEMLPSIFEHYIYAIDRP